MSWNKPNADMASAERFCISKDHFNQMKDSLCVKTCSLEHSKNTRLPSAMFFRWQQSQLRSWRHKGFSKRESSVIIYRKHCSVFETSGGEKSKGVDLLQAGLLYTFFTLYILLKYITNKTFWLPAEQKWTSSFSRYIRSILVMQLIFDWLF